MARIITEEMVKEAIRLAEPSALAVIATPCCNWGPQWVHGYVRVPDFPDIPFTFGEVTPWNKAWGQEMDFRPVAMRKVEASDRLGVNTSVIVALYPDELEEGEYLYAGGAHRNGKSASASGAKGRADEAIAEVILVMLNMLIQLEVDRRIAARQMQI